MSKLEEAVIALVRAKDEVRRLTTEIGNAIFESQKAQGFDKQPIDWLKLAYERESEFCENTYSREYYYVNHEEDIEGYLAEHCEHALRAHHLIQERKEARRVVGAASRRVSVMGRNLIKGMVKP